MMALMNYFTTILNLISRLKVVQLSSEMKHGLLKVVFWVGLFKVFGNLVKMAQISTTAIGLINPSLIKCSYLLQPMTQVR